MLEIFSDIHDALQELKDPQMDHGDGDTLLGIGKALGATLESVTQGGSSIIKAIGGAIHDTLNGVGDLDEKVVGSLGEAASKVIESAGHAVKDSTTGIGNIFHGILGRIGGTIQWCLILAVILVLLYINRSTLFKLCRNKPSQQLNTPTPPLPTPSTDSDPIPKKLVNPPPTVEQPTTLPLVLASFTLHDFSASHEKSGVIMPTTISSQHDHTSCSALTDTGSPVNLLSKKTQRQLNLLATLLESHYKLLRATGETLTTLGTVQVDILLDRKVWPNSAIVVSSLTHSLILGLKFLKLTKSKVYFESNTVETGSTLDPVNTHCMQSSTSTIIIPKSDVYRPCQLLLNKKTCWIIALMLTVVIILTAIVSHTHFNPPFKKQNKPLASSGRNLTWKELLTYGTTVRLKIRLQAARPENAGQLYFLDWTLPPVLEKRLHISTTLF